MYIIFLIQFYVTITTLDNIVGMIHDYTLNVKATYILHKFIIDIKLHEWHLSIVYKNKK